MDDRINEFFASVCTKEAIGERPILERFFLGDELEEKSHAEVSTEDILEQIHRFKEWQFKHTRRRSPKSSKRTHV